MESITEEKSVEQIRQEISQSRVVVDSLPSWAVIPDAESDTAEHAEVTFTPRFSVDKALNEKIILWRGDVLALQVDAIVNSTNEVLSEKTGVNGRMFSLAGPDMDRQVKQLDGCRTGESKITKAFSLPCASYVIHTVGPRYNDKYKTAAENALHSCYRSVLQILIENKLRTLGVYPINSPKRGYPRIEAAHVAIRTIRRFLEKWGEDIDRVCLVMQSEEDVQLYHDTLRLYFPRNNRDLIDSQNAFPGDIDEINEFGAKIIKEREIRIAAFPFSSSGDEESSPDRESSSFSEREASPFHRSTGHAIDLNSGLKAFMTPSSTTPDDIVRREHARKTPKQLENEAIDKQYAALLNDAKSEDLSDIKNRNCVYQSGVDSLGNPVLLIVGAKFPDKADRQLIQKLTKYLIRMLSYVATDKFSIIYFHSCINPQQEPEFAWLKLIYKICERKFFHNIQRFYIVHPSLWVKFTLKVMSPWLSPNFKNNLVHIEKLGVLFNSINQSTLKIPDFVYKHDRKMHGSAYLGEDHPANEGL